MSTMNTSPGKIKIDIFVTNDGCLGIKLLSNNEDIRLADNLYIFDKEKSLEFAKNIIKLSKSIEIK